MPINSCLKNSIFRIGIEDKSSIRPLFLSLTIAIGYIIIVSIYIWLSGIYAREIASSLENLKHIELTKGLIFALVTGTILFFTLFMILLKIKKGLEYKQNQLTEQGFSLFLVMPSMLIKYLEVAN
jgi:hypothetical protein